MFGAAPRVSELWTTQRSSLAGPAHSNRPCHGVSELLSERIARAALLTPSQQHIGIAWTLSSDHGAISGTPAICQIKPLSSQTQETPSNHSPLLLLLLLLKPSTIPQVVERPSRVISLFSSTTFPLQMIKKSIYEPQLQSLFFCLVELEVFSRLQFGHALRLLPSLTS